MLKDEGRMVKFKRYGKAGTMKSDDFRERTKRFAIQIPGKQLIRSGTSIAANFREACRARSKSEFISKIGICIQEADETQLWLELLHEGFHIRSDKMDVLLNESKNLLPYWLPCQKTARTMTNPSFIIHNWTNYAETN